MSAPAQRPEPTLEEQVRAHIGDDGSLSRQPFEREEEEREEAPPDESAASAADPEGDDAPESEESEESEGEEAPESEAAAPESVETLSDLARVFDVPEAELMEHLQVQLGDGTASLANVIELARTPIEERVQQAVAREREGIEAKVTERQQQLDAARTKLEETTARLMDSIQDRFAKVNWQQLREDDPQQYMILRQDFEDSKARANAALHQLREEESRQRQERDRLFEEWKDSERAKLLALPEFQTWAKDPAAGRSGRQALDSYLMESHGLEKELVDELVDHRLVRIAHKAFLYDQLQKKGKLAAERVRQAPKMLPGGGRKPRPDPHLKRRAETRKRARQSGRVEDAAAAIESLDIFNE